MAWTTTALIQDHVPSASLLELGPYVDKGTMAVKNRLANFVALTILNAWTTELIAPEQVVDWASRMGAAHFMADVQGFHLTPEIPDNPAARLYDFVEKEIQKAARRVITIIDRANAAVPISAVAQSTCDHYFDIIDEALT